MSSIARVRRFYDATAPHEAQRLRENTYRRLERDMTVRTLAKHVPRGARLLDIGGGPGEYLAPLTELGFDVSLCDLSSANVRLARKEATRLALDDVPRRVRRANATDLGAYERASFDAALVAGPFYHLVDPRAQEQALAEIARVVRPGGVVVFAILPRLHPLRYLLREGDAATRRAFTSLDWSELLAQGRYRNPLGDAAHPTLFTDAYLWEVGEFKAFLKHAGGRVVDTLSAESFCAFLDVPLCAWIKREEDYQRVLDLVDLTARRPDQIGAAEHVLVVARMPGRRAKRAERVGL